MSKILPNIGNLIIAVATTWYVVFTYFILKATDDMRKRTADPFLLITWSKTPDVQDNKFNYEIISESLKKAGFDFQNYSSEERTISDRFANLEIQNERSAVLGLLEIAIELVLNQSSTRGITTEPVALSWSDRRVGLNQGDRLIITVADLTMIPETFDVNIYIKRIKYRSIDSLSDISGYNGDRVFACKGMVSLQATLPHKAAMGMVRKDG